MRPLLIAAIALGWAGSPQPEDVPCSPLTLVADLEEERLILADFTRRGLAVFHVGREELVDFVDLPGAPNGLALSGDGKWLYVTLAAPEGRVQVLDAVTFEPLQSLAAGHMPGSPVLESSGERLWICNRFEGLVRALGAQSGEIQAEVPVAREPVAAVLTPDDALLLVGHQIPDGAADGAHAATGISFIDTRANELIAHLGLPNGSTDLYGLCLGPDGRYAFATHVLSRYQLPTTQLERGWINTNALSIVDVKERALVNTVLLDDVDLGAANPWGVVCSADGETLLVTHAGSHELSVIDLPELMAKLDGLDENEAAEVCNDLAFLVGLRRRVKLGGRGPRGLTLAAGRVWVAEYFSGTLGSVALPLAARVEVKSFALGHQPEPSPERRGEELFHDATICFQQWQSCASCHPGVRADGLNWDLLNDGFGNPKQTKSLVWAHRTPPAMVTGIRADAPTAVRAGLRYIHFATRPEEEALAIDAFLDSLEPLPSPHLVDGELGPAALRGAQVFTRAGCAHCHAPPLFTDQKEYLVGSGLGRERNTGFDSPTLVEVWRTAPYLHDGRAPDLRSLFTEHNHEDRHGVTSDLGEAELADLIAYVLSL